MPYAYQNVLKSFWLWRARELPRINNMDKQIQEMIPLLIDI